jgi:hypothetical protein
MALDIMPDSDQPAIRVAHAVAAPWEEHALPSAE